MASPEVTKKNPPADRPAVPGPEDDGMEEEEEAPDQVPSPPKRGRRPVRGWMVWLVVFLLLAGTASGLVAFNGTARSRVSALIRIVMRRPPAPEPEQPPTADEEALAQARAELEAEKQRLDALAQTLAAKEAELSLREQAVSAAEADLAARLADLAQDEADIERLARLCEIMRPREAAELIARLEDEKALTILGFMDETTAAKILAAMPRDRAAALMKLMAPAAPG